MYIVVLFTLQVQIPEKLYIKSISVISGNSNNIVKSIELMDGDLNWKSILQNADQSRPAVIFFAGSKAIMSSPF